MDHITIILHHFIVCIKLRKPKDEIIEESGLLAL